MQTASVVNIKNELKYKSAEDLTQLCLRLAKFKKENKELLSYLFFESHDENAYVESIKVLIDSQFESINTKSFFYIKKSVRKILTQTKKYVRYSQQKETEVELLLYFCKKLKALQPSYKKSVQLQNLYNRQTLQIKKIITTLHDDLQYDYTQILKNL